jgi:beta-lactamase class A
MISRRQFAIATGSGFLSGMLGRRGELHAAEGWPEHLKQDIIRLEAVLNSRLGVTVLDSATGQRIGHHGSERFPMCSTFKVLAAAAVLKRVDAGQEDLNRRIRFDSSEVVTYSPVTKERAGGNGMTLAELCEAAITQSDNTAGNMILKTLGGPSELTTYARSLGDMVTRLDRWETDLNEATPGDPRDTTTPDAMTANLHALVVQDRLSPHSREQLTRWLVSNKTGDAKLRAGLPKDWRIGDKTGGGNHGTMNDVAVIWPPKRRPVIVSVYMTETKTSFDDRNAAIAELGRSIKSALAA